MPFQLTINITGLCLIAYNDTKMHVLMPATAGNPNVVEHHGDVRFDLGSTEAGGSPLQSYRALSLNGRYLAIDGSAADGFVPPASPDLFNLSSVFGKTVPSHFASRRLSSDINANVEITTGKTFCVARGNEFKVRYNPEERRRIGWNLKWRMSVDDDSITLSANGAQSSDAVTLYPHSATNELEVVISHRPDMPMAPVPQALEHFKAIYDLLGITEHVPVCLTKDAGTKCDIPFVESKDVHIWNDSFTCVPGTGILG